MRNIRRVLGLVLAMTLLVGGTLTVSASNLQEITQDSQEQSAEIELIVEIDSSFTVGIPTSATIDPKTGTGGYDVSVKGDLDPLYKLVVAPVDSYSTQDGDTTSNINFKLEDTSNPLAPKDPIIVDITPGQTEFDADDINEDTETIVNNTMAVSSGEFSAGSWEGTIRYSISLQLITP